MFNYTMASNINQKQECVLNNQKASDIDLILSEASTSANRVVKMDGTHVRRSVMGLQQLPSNYLPPNLNQLISRNITQQNLVPPLPPRPGQLSNYNNYFGGGNMYSQFPRYGTGMYGPSYGGYRTPYNRLGSPYYEGGMENNSIIQLAEESTRPAFQSIETIVEAVGSISMMLESTYHAVHSSYSAILGVVDNFSRLKDRLTEMLSVLALLRGLQWLCLKVLYLLGIRKSDPSNEAAWSAASKAANDLFNVPGTNSKQSAWPILIFISLVFGAPWLMFRLLANKVANKTFDPSLWLTQNGTHQVATVMYDFTSSRPGELSVRAGQRIIVAPRSLQPKPIKGWVLASPDLKSSGLVPANYLQSKSANGNQAPNTKKSSPATIESVPEPQQSSE